MTRQRGSGSGTVCFQDEFSDVVWLMKARLCYKAFVETSGL